MKSICLVDRKPLVLALLPILTCNPLWALAQDKGLTLEEIVVTAQRKEETLQKAAIPVDVATGQELINAGITQLGRLGELIPAVTILPATGNLIFIRGVGNFTLTSNSDSAAAFNYDGVYIGRPTSSFGMFFDLERIEVLKGPQGTLYGRNATAGAINVIPVRPTLNETSGYIDASYGEYDDIDSQVLKSEGAVNLPVSENTAIRLSASVVDQDPVNYDETNDDKSQSVRLQVLSELTPDLTLRLAGDYANRDGTGPAASYSGSYSYNPLAGYSYTPADLRDNEGFYTTAAQDFRATQFVMPAGRFLDDLGDFPFQNNDYYGFHAEIAYETEMGVLTVIPSWRKAELDYLSDAAAFLYRQNESDEQYSLETRFAGQAGIFDYIVGGYYFEEDISINTALTLGSVASWLDFDYTTESYAGFAQITANMTDRFRLVGGMRYTDDKKTSDGTSTGGASVCVTFPTTPCLDGPLFPLADSPEDLPFSFPSGAGAPPIFIPPGSIVARTDFTSKDDLENDRSTYRAAVEYDLALDSLIYTSVETGYRSGGFSPAAGYETFSPEELTAYTIGSKNRFMDQTLEVNVEVFYWDYNNQQVSHVALDSGGRTANITENIGKAEIKGVEVESSYLLTSTTLIRADVQYLNAKNTSFVYQEPNTAGVPPLSGCDVSLVEDGTEWNVDCSDLDSVNSPEWTLNLALQQSFALGDRHQLVFNLDTQYKSQRYLGFDYIDQMKVGSFWRSNALISLASNEDSWSVGAYIRNIGNESTPGGISKAPNTNFITVGLLPQRNYGVQVAYRF